MSLPQHAQMILFISTAFPVHSAYGVFYILHVAIFSFFDTVLVVPLAASMARLCALLATLAWADVLTRHYCFVYRHAINQTPFTASINAILAAFFPSLNPRSYSSFIKR